jgi:ABC-type transport system involved in multi-copper enzyme maturation permease subunit
MANVLTLFRREFQAYFDSSIAYIFMIVFLLASTWLFMAGFFLSGLAGMRGYFEMLPWFALFFLPAVSMRLWAEDLRTGTMELLMTLPMKTWELVLGKYLAALAFYALTLAGTLAIPIILEMIGDPDSGAIFGGYLASLLLGGFYIAVGIFVSGLFKDQIAAFVVSLMFCLFFYFAGTGIVVATTDGWINGLGSFIERNVAVTSHFSEIQRGIIDLRNLVYFFSMTALFLVLNTLSLDGRRY